MNATEVGSAGSENEGNVTLLAGLVTGGGFLVLIIIVASAIIATLACHNYQNARKRKFHIGDPVRPLSYDQSMKSFSLTSIKDDHQLQELHSCLEDRSYKMSFRLKDKTVATPPSPQGTNREIETVFEEEQDNFEGKPRIEITRQVSHPLPITHVSPSHAPVKESSLSISSRPRLPTPNTAKVTNSNRNTPASPTPITQVRTSQWYDNVRQMFHHIRSSRNSTRSIEESSGHYINDDMGPTKHPTDKSSAAKATVNNI